MEKEKDTDKKTILQKLKRLMTVTEKDVIEEKEKERKRLKEAKPPVDNESRENKNDVTEQREIKKVKRPVLKIVGSDSHFDESDNEPEEESPPVENEDEVELIGNRERVVQDKAKLSKKSSDENTESDTQQNENKIPYDHIGNDDDDDDDGEYSTEDDEEDEMLYDLDELTSEPEKKPRKKKKSFFNSLFKFGQALNAKPDEFASDEEISKPYKNKHDKSSAKSDNSDNPESVTAGLQNQSKAENTAIKNEVAESTISQSEPQISKGPPILDIDMSFTKVQKVNGNIFIQGDIEPMYTIESTSTTFNIEIGKLSPILLNAYEEYLGPEVLEAKKAEQAKKQAEVLDEEIITKATTAFGDPKKKETEETTQTQEEAPKDKTEDETTAKGESTEKEVEEMFAEEDRKKLAKKKAKEEKRRKKKEAKANKAKKPKQSVKDKLFSDYSTTVDYSAFSANDEKVEKIEDYEAVQDARAVMVEINMNIRKLFFRTLVVSIVFVLELAITVFQRFFPWLLENLLSNVDMIYCVANIVLLSVAVGVSAVTIKNGLTPLIGFKGNSDTAVAVATIATIMQCIVSFFDCYAFYHGTQSLYVILVMFALLLNSLGKMVMMLRIKDNFRFVAQDRKKYALTILNDKRNAEKMVRGTNAADPIIAYQRKTDFYKNFLKLSYAQDPSENMASKFSLIGLVCSVVVAIIHGIMFQSVTGAFSAFAMVACLSVPVACMLAVNIPMKQLCKQALHNDAMIVGYPAVTQFVDTAAIMVDSKELYPRSSVKLVSLKPYVTSNLETCLLNAAAVLKIANTSLTYVFSDVIDQKDDNLPYVDSVKFEENKGIVGWIGGERVLIGRRELLKKYGVEVPPYDDERPYADEQRNITYLANAGQLVAMIVTAYSPENRIKKEIQRLEENGVSVLVRTADPNLTSKRIASDYGLHVHSVKILPNSLGNICKEAINERSRRARCYIGTRGKIYSLARAVSGCIKIKSNITLAVIIQMIGLVMGIVFTTAVALVSGEQGMGAFELLCFMIFWAVASIVVPLLQKP